MPLNVIVLEFDPVLRIGELEVRLETIGLAVVLAMSLIVAGAMARATPAGDVDAPDRGRVQLREDDLLLIALGALPGAILGGRIGHIILHTDYYLAHPARIVDPAAGSLELTLGVVGGILTAAYVLHRLEAPIWRWAHAAAFPLLLALGAGKLVQALGGDGQGLPSDLPWATLYSGDGPWGSLAADIPSHPSQVYEGIAVLLLLQALTILAMRGAFRRADGSALLVGLGLWALVRVVVAATWRDAPILGPLRAEQLIALGLAVGCGLLLAGRRAQRRRLDAQTARSGDATERVRRMEEPLRGAP